MGSLVFLFVLASAPFSPAAAQPQASIAITPGYINLGMTTSVAITAPAAGSYTVLVVKPGGQTAQVTANFNTAGQTQTFILGDSSLGFASMVDQAGTYNVYLEQGTQVISSTTFYATNVINITTDFIVGGTCLFVASSSRGQNLLIQIHATYASNGLPMAMTANESIAKGNKVTYTLPDGTMATATVHGSSPRVWPVPWYQGHVSGNWNASWVGPYTPMITATDMFGNTGKLDMSKQGYTFIYSPATLNTAVQLADSATGKQISGLTSAETINITATVAYLVTPTAIQALKGFNGPLDSATRGGVVNAVIGWGYYNATTGNFGSAKQPGGLIATAPLTYSSAKKAWVGQFNTGTLPTLVNATTYQVIVASHDSASPPNTGFATLTVPPMDKLQLTTATTTSVSTFISTTTTTTPSITTATSISTATTTTVSVAVSTFVESVQSVPMWGYAIMAVLLIAGLAVGTLVKGPKPK